MLLYYVNMAMTLGLDRYLLTPLECLGIKGYKTKLLFWMVSYPAALGILWFGLLLYLSCRRRFSGRAFGEIAIGMSVKLLFLFYPVINTIAFEAFACHEFEEYSGGPKYRYLIDDVSIRCNYGDPVYDEVTFLAWLAILLYPVGAMVLCLVLLLCARNAIRHPKDTASLRLRWLARGLAFLHQEYTPEFYFWEVVEMLRRFLLVGLAVVIFEGTSRQIILGTLISCTFLFLQLQIHPYLDRADDFLAGTSSFMLVLCFASCIVFKYNSMMEVQYQARLLSPEQVLS